MKWTPKTEDKLKKLCFEEKSNAEMAKIFNCGLKDIHAARSRLGITIPKVKAAKAQDKPVQAANKKPTATKTDPWAPIKAAFDRLDKALLDAAEVDPVNGQALRQVAGGISLFKALLLNAVE